MFTFGPRSVSGKEGAHFPSVTLDFHRKYHKSGYSCGIQRSEFLTVQVNYFESKESINLQWSEGASCGTWPTIDAVLEHCLRVTYFLFC